MVINARTKQAIHSFSPTALTALALYLPYRADTLHNLKTLLYLERSQTHHREHSENHMKVEENTISFYIDELVNSTLFNAEANLCLHHIFTQILASKEQTDSLLNYRQYEHEDIKKYIDC